jgi:5-hydroxyisourate hydrolase-like protein (transthyretin family)
MATLKFSRPSTLLLLPLISTACLLTTATAQRAKAAPQPTGTLTGYVGYSDTKAPARIAQILLIKLYPAKSPTDSPDSQPKAALGGAGLSTFTQTGLDGRFVMPNVPVGKYIVVAQQNGALNPIARIDLDALNKIQMSHLTEDQIKDNLADLTVAVIEPNKTDNVAVSLTHGASISGTLNYDDGSPAVGVQVHLMIKTHSGAFAEPDMMSMGMAASNATLGGYVTDEAGRFHIAGLPPGAYALRASLPFGQLKNLGASLKGIISLGMSSPDSMASAMKTDSGLSVYSGNVLFRKDLKPIELTDGQAYTGADITVPLNGMFTVQARVEDAATGKPVDVAQVQLMDADGHETLRSQFVDDDGTCTFEYVPIGQYTLQVVNAMDLSAVGKILDDNYDPKKAVPYTSTPTKIQVSGNTEGIVLQLTKPTPAKPAP